MSYIDKNLLADEQIIFRTKKHLIIFLYPALWTLFSIAALYFMLSSEFLAKIYWLPFVAALIFWLQVYLEYLTSEYAVTNRRLMLREGLFQRHTYETRLSAIAQVNVMQSLMGQLFNYGTVSINTFGNTMDAFPLISKPNDFQKAVNQQLDTIIKR
jgi:uncharacterized membrane protein YdbT with pleckstrin-like domain